MHVTTHFGGQPTLVHHHGDEHIQAYHILLLISQVFHPTNKCLGSRKIWHLRGDVEGAKQGLALGWVEARALALTIIYGGKEERLWKERARGFRSLRMEGHI